MQHEQMSLVSNSIRDKYGFTIADNVVLMSTKIPNHSKLLYFHLKNFYYKASQAFDLGYDKTFYISREELGKLMQMSASNVDEYMKPLKKVGLVETKSQGIGKPNVYVLPEITEDIVDLLEPDIRKFKQKKNGSPNTVNDQIKSTENGSPNTVNDRIESRTPQNTVKDPTEYGQQINNNKKINKYNINNTILPSNMPKQQLLFTDNSASANTQEIVFKKRKGKSRSLEIIELYKQGRIPVTRLDMLDLCYYYTILHKQIVGTVVSVVTKDKKSESDLSLFMSAYDLDNEKFVRLLPKILETFVELDSVKPKTKRQRKLNIGNLAHSWFMDPIMDKVLPKVNTKYLDDDNTDYKGANPYRQVDEVF